MIIYLRICVHNQFIVIKMMHCQHLKQGSETNVKLENDSSLRRPCLLDKRLKLSIFLFYHKKESNVKTVIWTCLL